MKRNRAPSRGSFLAVRALIKGQLFCETNKLL
ncbi:hypothetical protein QFZ78_007281 [Paenibacillus sp. V4I5]|nr:hypothetical protein [Paenibacillus sp. V4I5]